ncbi:hypothetical protein GCM10023149_11140 [Mucilaginibacter gynuensis]|uniref:histidine kinase n=1 Tax=Mucilaginibacter gynuensis TaxID=1302236 RepID=A0ABP8G0K6_9SPHI
MSGALRISLIFLFIGLLWVTLSDALAFYFIDDKTTLQQVNLYKGYFFMIVISVLLHSMVKSNNKLLLKKTKFIADAEELAHIGGWEYFPTERRMVISKELRRILKIANHKSDFDVTDVADYVHPDDIKLVRDKFSAAVTNHTNLRLVHRAITGDEQVLFVEQIAKIEYADGLPYLVRGTVQDITQTIELRDTLAKTSQENQHLLDIMSKIKSMVIITDKNGLVTWINPAFTKRTGYTLEDMAGKRPSQILHGPETSAEAFNAIQQDIINERYTKVEILNYTKTGEKYWVEVNITPIVTDNRLSGFITIQVDITEKKAYQEKLQHQNTLLNEVAWMTSHEIRKPVASILALAELSKHASSREEKDEYVDVLVSCVEDLDNIVRHFTAKINTIEQNKQAE